MKEIIFWGATGQSLVLHDLISQTEYKLVALFDKNEQVKSPINGIPLFYGTTGFEKWLSGQKHLPQFAIAVGGKHGTDRVQLFNYLISKKLSPATLIHHTAFISAEATIGEGCQVLAHAAVITKATLGTACIINTKASVDHECKLGNGVHLAPGVTLGGCVEIGHYSFIATGAIILPGIKIGSNVIVGAGAVVTKDLPDEVIAYGNPARIIRKNQLR